MQESVHADAALDRILDEAIAEFEEEELHREDRELQSNVKNGFNLRETKKRMDREVEDEMKTEALSKMESLVENIRDPKFEGSLGATLQALSGNTEGIRTITQFMKGQKDAFRTAIPIDSDDRIELDRNVATTMEHLAKEAHDMEGMDTAQVEHVGEHMMASMIAEFEKLGQKEDFDQIVENMMRQLLARDLMYEPMKLVCDKFPEWLATYYDHLSEDEYCRYGTQYQYFQRIVAVYEHEPDNFHRLMELLQDLQAYGQPPSEIIKELAPGLEFSEDGMPIMNMGDNVFPKPGAEPGMPGIPMPDADLGCPVM